MNKLNVLLALTVFPLVLSACGLSLDDKGEGILIYLNGKILNDSMRDIPKGKDKPDPLEIVAKRAQQLNAASASGGAIVWESDNPAIIEVADQTGLIRVGQALGKTATISASLRDNPGIKAEVTFIVRDLR